ncbi:hypothetical protein B0A55_12513 [Friedmanniomyces simplex]|uniref:Uncharacterized protein n=1 Tax=Friedmanniomyces simplex TaxID=329884 RepID=A0A4U0W6A1_9PEZI|nr:hypothetical protein B0A55_12513 [Friedmanniomyces simplex]
MLLALVSGALLATGHHLFYQSLAGGRAPTGTYKIAGANVSKQQFNTTVGTAFAFLVKALLALAVGVAYTQAFWRAAKTSKNGLTLSNLDTTFSIIGDAAGFLKLKVWGRHPLLLLLAVVAWTIPIASIVTPATLSVVSAAMSPPPMIMTKVPDFDFVNLNFLAGMTAGGTGGDNYTEYCYEGPGQLVQRVATAVSVQGEILPISAPALNASWTLEFAAPALRCSPVTGAAGYPTWDSILQFMNDTTRCEKSYGYLSWMETSPEDIVPFAKRDGSPAFKTQTAVSGVPVAFWVATMPQMFQVIPLGADVKPGGCMLQAKFGSAHNVSQPIDGFGSAMQGFFNDSTLLRCEVLNSSYAASFDYTNGDQDINPNVRFPSPAKPLISADCVTGPEDPYRVDTNPRGQIALNNLQNASCSTLNVDGKQCLFDPVLAQSLSYQSIVEAFSRRILGSIGLDGGSANVPALNAQSEITETILMDTEDLAFVANWHMNPDQTNKMWYNLQTMTQIAKGTSFVGLTNVNLIGSRGPLASVLEQLFQNVTMSILSEPSLQPNRSSPYAPQALTTLTVETYENVYAYAARTLWIAYGLAILSTVLAVMIGFTSLILAGASFDGSFSTVLRVGRTARLTEEMRDGDGDGHQPLPKHLKTARLIVDDSGEYKPVQ